MTEYKDLFEHFDSDTRIVDNALARYFLGYPIHGAPDNWDWNEIMFNFHVPTKTLSLLMAIQLRHTHGVDLEAELR